MRVKCPGPGPAGRRRSPRDRLGAAPARAARIRGLPHRYGRRVRLEQRRRVPAAFGVTPASHPEQSHRKQGTDGPRRPPLPETARACRKRLVPPTAPTYRLWDRRWSRTVS